MLSGAPTNRGVVSESQNRYSKFFVETHLQGRGCRPTGVSSGGCSTFALQLRACWRHLCSRLSGWLDTYEEDIGAPRRRLKRVLAVGRASLLPGGGSCQQCHGSSLGACDDCNDLPRLQAGFQNSMCTAVLCTVRSARHLQLSRCHTGYGESIRKVASGAQHHTLHSSTSDPKASADYHFCHRHSDGNQIRKPGQSKEPAFRTCTSRGHLIRAQPSLQLQVRLMLVSFGSERSGVARTG